MNQIKALLLSALAWGAVSLSNSKAQVDVTLNPVNALFGDINLGADIRVSDYFSIEPNVGYGTGKALYFEYQNIPATVFGKYYFSPKNGADRFYADVFARFVHRKFGLLDEASQYAEYEKTRFGLGVGAGYKVASEKGFIFDFGIGVGRAVYDDTKFTSEGEEVEASWSSGMVIAKVGLGYRFGGGRKSGY